MAAAGPGAAASAALGRRSGRKPKRNSGARTATTPAVPLPREGPAGEGPANGALPLEDSVCPVCLEILVEPVTMPCRHSLCLPCFRRNVELVSLCCPLCRLRVSSWARRCSRDNALVDGELWERVRRSHPERCRRRLAQERGQPAPPQENGRPEEEEEAPGPGPEQRPDPLDFIFRAPIKLSKPGELREEYESQLRKLKDEKKQEEIASEELIRKLLQEETEEEKKKMEELRKDELLAIKLSQSCVTRHLSDSENEEPCPGRTAHRSAFVSKSSSYSLAALTGTATSKVERSQSCNDTVKERSKSRHRLGQAIKAKNPSGSSAVTGIVGVLLSSENSRSFSAPDLTSEKRLCLASLSSLSVLHKPERSISPESNDSISEELNHFKPIVCSPCTPPKKLPDGQVLSPVLIKSTPRNLRRNLQKPTTYEASPRVLKKWELIFQERQAKKTLSKGTLTSGCEERLVPDVLDHSTKTSVTDSTELSINDHVSPNTTVLVNPKLDLLPSVSGESDMEHVANSKTRASVAALIVADTSFLPPPGDSQASDILVDVNANVHLGSSLTASNISWVCQRVPENSLVRASIKSAGKRQLRNVNHYGLASMQNGTCCAPVENGGDQPPPLLRRGQKRRCKTKHLEHSGSLKRLREAAGELGVAVGEPFWREYEQRLQQEEEDRKLACQLQRMFDSERRTVNRRKGSRDEYPLRSQSTTELAKGRKVILQH
ncbi:E3 ubiquitin-protein ligase RNF169 isoform X1 [Rhinatrema bivittatum]|uniref:E3 ubiquitin-protein ligase RNF169 isoform X1 n=1 Tax=Rhinatrema bivittatum TaxID=194408 RepID=UPI001125F968|nr:E3 ubiquitin-protein ligase RNF169 isoform X1 [Rhinatrema bivittatum]